MPSSCTSADDVGDIEDCVQPGDPTPADRLRAENKVLPRALRRKIRPLEVEADRPVTESFIPGTQSVYVKTWGCSHNNSDGEYMAGLLAAGGYRIVDSPLTADLWLLNSCTVKGPSEDGLKNSIRKGRELGKPLVVAGCVPQGQKNHPDIQGLSVVGVQQIDRVVEVVEETLKGLTVRLFRQKRENGHKLGGAPLDLPKIRKNPLVEIIPINTGCLNQCTYCKTKHARGDLGSYPPEEIVSRAKQAFQEGVVEIWLTSEDLGAYGHDIGITLPGLLWQLVTVIPEGCMLRLGMTNPPYIMEHLEEMAGVLSHPRVYSFLHVPVQCGSDPVLADMKREYTVADFRHVVDFLKERVPAITIATDIICGFPTETAEDFEGTLHLVDDYRFPSLFINQFYPRPGTPAARMKRVPTHEVKRRSRKLTQLFQSYRPYDHKVGERQRVLVTEESHDGVHLVAHNKYYDQVLVPKEPGLMGKMFEVVVTSTGKHYLIGEVVMETLVRVPVRPCPLPHGCVSGAPKKKKEVKFNDTASAGTIAWDSRQRTLWLSLGDCILLLMAVGIVCVAVLIHYRQLSSVFR